MSMCQVHLIVILVCVSYDLWVHKVVEIIIGSKPCTNAWMLYENTNLQIIFVV